MPKPKTNARVAAGARVTVCWLAEDEVETFRLADGGDYNSSENLIPSSSPFAQAILDRVPGDTVEFETRGSLQKAQIIDVHFD